MANYNNLKATINANIKANGNEEITGPILNTVLNQAVTTLGDGWSYKGIATPSMSPGTPDSNVFYIATTAGTYTNFGSLVVAEGEVAILKYNGSWAKEVTGAATAAQVTQLGQNVEENATNIVNLQQEVDAIQPIIIEGNVTNAPDEEDITTDSNDLLKFADRPTAVNQMGYVILRKNKTFAEQVTKENTIYEIRYPFTLSSDFTMPSGCILKFNGGQIDGNATITGERTSINADLVQIFGGGISFAGTWIVHEAPVEWCGARKGVISSSQDTDVANCINKLFGISGVVVLAGGAYYQATHGVQINIRGTLRGIEQRREGKGAGILFRDVVSNTDCVLVGKADGTVSDRVKDYGIENVTLLVNIVTPSVVGVSCVHIGAVSHFNIRNCTIQNMSTRSSDYSASEYEDPVSVSNYAVKITGTSEFIRCVSSSFLADIPIYTVSGSLYDFTTFDKCSFVANAYGYACMYGVPITSNTNITGCSFNQGIFGIKWSGDGTGVVKISGCRFEQLRNYTYNGGRVSAAFDYTTGSPSYANIHPAIYFDSIGFPGVTAIRISGNEEVYVSMVGCTGLNLSNSQPAIDIFTAPYTWIECVNNYMGWNVVYKVNETTHQVKGVRVRNQQNASYASSLSNASFVPIADISTIRNKTSVRYHSSANRSFSIPFEQDLAVGSKSPFFDRLKLWDNDNKCLGYSVNIKVFGPGVYGEATYLVKYAVSNDAIDETNGTISIIETKGDDIFSTNGPGNYEAGKMSIYISTNPGANVQLAEYNNIGKAVHIVGEVEAYLTTALLNSISP
jgi:hypothetical protein